MIRFKNVHIGYNFSLYSIGDLILEPQNVYALLGKNGSGKSTLLHTIFKDVNPVSGHISLEDKPIENLNFQDIARQIAFVESRFDGIPHMTAQEYVLLGRIPFLSRLAKVKKDDLEVVERAFEFLGIEHLTHRFTERLSDGERQMVNIAKAIAQETPIIILDEPSAFLDYSNKLKLMVLLKEIAKLNKTVILSTHDLELAHRHADHLLCIDSENKILKTFQVDSVAIQDIISICF